MEPKCPEKRGNGRERSHAIRNVERVKHGTTSRKDCGCAFELIAAIDQERTAEVSPRNGGQFTSPTGGDRGGTVQARRRESSPAPWWIRPVAPAHIPSALYASHPRRTGASARASVRRFGAADPRPHDATAKLQLPSLPRDPAKRPGSSARGCLRKRKRGILQQQAAARDAICVQSQRSKGQRSVSLLRGTPELPAEAWRRKSREPPLRGGCCFGAARKVIGNWVNSPIRKRRKPPDPRVIQRLPGRLGTFNRCISAGKFQHLCLTRPSSLPG